MIKRLEGVALDSLILTFVKVLTILVTIIITMVLSRYYTLDEYGIYSEALLIVTISTSISILGLSDAVNYFYNSDKTQEAKKTYISTIFTIQVFFGGLIGLMIILGRNQISSFFDSPNLASVLIIIAFMPLLNNLLAMTQVLYVSIGKSRVIAYRNIVVSILKLISVVFSIIVFDDIIIVLVAILLTDFFQLLILILRFRTYKFGINLLLFDKSILSKILKYSIPLAIYILVNTFSREIDKLVIGNLMGTSQLALYTNASKILPFDILTISFALVLIPIITGMISRNDYGEAAKLFKVYLKFSYITTWILAMGAILLSRELLIFLYSEKYLEALNVFRIYILVDMIRFANVSIIMRAEGKTSRLLVISMLALFANLILNIIFYNIFGFEGPSVATFVVTLIYNVVILSYASKILKVSIRKIISLHDMIRLLLIGSLVSLIILTFKTNLISFEKNTLTLVVYFSFYGLIMISIYGKKVYRLMINVNLISKKYKEEEV